MRSEVEDSNLTQSSYHITVEEGPDVDDTNDDVQEAPPQLEDGVQLIVTKSRHSRRSTSNLC